MNPIPVALGHRSHAWEIEDKAALFGPEACVLAGDGHGMMEQILDGDSDMRSGFHPSGLSRCVYNTTEVYSVISPVIFRGATCDTH